MNTGRPRRVQTQPFPSSRRLVTVAYRVLQLTECRAQFGQITVGDGTGQAMSALGQGLPVTGQPCRGEGLAVLRQFQ